jgi:hypothetical protein
MSCTSTSLVMFTSTCCLFAGSQLRKNLSAKLETLLLKAAKQSVNTPWKKFGELLRNFLPKRKHNPLWLL